MGNMTAEQIHERHLSESECDSHRHDGEVELAPIDHQSPGNENIDSGEKLQYKRSDTLE